MLGTISVPSQDMEPSTVFMVGGGVQARAGPLGEGLEAAVSI